MNFFMNKFRKLGFIDYNGHLKIHRSLLDVVLHDDPKQLITFSQSGGHLTHRPLAERSCCI